MPGNGRQSRYTAQDADAAASAAGVELGLVVAGITFSGKTRLPGTCKSCGQSAKASIRQMRVGSFPCACQHKNLRLWGDPKTDVADVWAGACDACGISTEQQFRAFDNQVYQQLKQRGLIDEIASHSMLLRIKRKTRWKTMPLQELEDYIAAHDFISDAVEAAVKVYRHRTGDNNLSELLSRHPGLKLVRRQNIDPEHLHIKEMARRIKGLALASKITTLKDFESADSLGPFLYGQRARRIKVRGNHRVLAALSRWSLLTGLLPDEQPFNRRPEEKVDDNRYIEAFSAMLRDEIRRQRLCGNDVRCIGDLWTVSGGSLAKRLGDSLKKRFPDTVVRTRIRRKIAVSAGLTEPLRDYEGFTLNDAIRESIDDGIISLGQLRQEKWALYSWLSRNRLLGEFIKQMNFGPIWRDAVAGDPYSSSFEAIAAGVMHQLQLSFKAQARILDGRAYRSDFYLLAPVNRHVEVWGAAANGKSTHWFPHTYRSKRQEKESIYAKLEVSGMPRAIGIEAEPYWRNEDWSAFAKHAHNILVEELELSSHLTDGQIIETCRIAQFNVHLTLDEATAQICALLGPWANAPMTALFPLFSVNLHDFSPEAIRLIRDSDDEVRRLLLNLTIRRYSCTVGKMVDRKTSRVFFSFTRHGGPLLTLLEALRYREQELPRP